MKRMKYYVYSTMSNAHRRQVSRSKPVAAAASYKYIKQQENEYIASCCIYQIIEKQNCPNLLRQRCRGYDACRLTVFSNAL